jgi:hypothetical protein
VHSASRLFPGGLGRLLLYAAAQSTLRVRAAVAGDDRDRPETACWARKPATGLQRKQPIAYGNRTQSIALKATFPFCRSQCMRLVAAQVASTELFTKAMPIDAPVQQNRLSVSQWGF